MTRFGTAVGQGKYSLTFETDNHEHFKHMQSAARHCVDGHPPYQQMLEELTKAKAENERLEKEVKMYASVNDSLIEDQEILKKKLHDNETLWKATAKTLQDEIDRLTKELDEERKQHSDLAASCLDDQCECNRLRVENEKLKKALDSACSSMGVCKESYTTLIQKLNSENDQLRKELIDERDCYDKLTSYEQERNKMLQEAKTKAKRAEMAYNTVMSILERDGYDVFSLFIETGVTVAAAEMKEKHDRG